MVLSTRAVLRELASGLSSTNEKSRVRSVRRTTNGHLQSSIDIYSAKHVSKLQYSTVLCMRVSISVKNRVISRL